jgi:hypothetical protein
MENLSKPNNFQSVESSYRPRNEIYPMVILDALLWLAVLPVALVVSSAFTLWGMEFGARYARSFAGELTGKIIEWIVFAVRSVIFVGVGTLIAPSHRAMVAIVLGVIHLIVSETPFYNRVCWLGTFLGTSATVGYLIAMRE